MGRCQWFGRALWTRLRREGSEGSEGSKGSEGKVLRIDRPAAGGFLSLTGHLAPRVADCPSGNTYKVSVTGFTFSVIWHEKHSAELSAFGRYTPYPAVPDFPRSSVGQSKGRPFYGQAKGLL